LESLYKKREEYDEKIKDYSSNKTKLFISGQLEILNKEERFRDIHGIYVNHQTAFQLASLDNIFKLVRKYIKNNFIVHLRSLLFHFYLYSRQQ
jgi:hypothetical protein